MNIDVVDEDVCNLQFHQLDNGRCYRVIECIQPYTDGEYPTGGFVIQAWFPLAHKWLYVDNSPSAEAVDHFLKAASRLSSV